MIRATGSQDPGPVGLISSQRSLIASSGSYVAITATQAVGSVALLSAATTFLSPAEFGLIAIAAAVAQLMRGLAAAGLPSAITITYFNRGMDVANSRSLLACAALVSGGLGLVAVVILFALRPVIAERFDFGLILFGAAIGTAMAVALHVQSWTRCVERISLYAAATLGTGAAAQSVGLAGFLVASASARTYLTGWALGALGAASITLVATSPRSPRSLPQGYFASAVKLGLPTVLHTLAIVLLSTGDRFMITSILGSAAAGRYHAVYLLSSAGLLVAGALSAAWAPYVLRQRTPDARSSALEQSTSLFLIVTFAIGAIAALVGPVVLHMASSAAYDVSGLRLTATVVSLTVVPYTLYLGAQISLLGTERTKSIAICTIIAAGVNIATNAVLIPSLGLLGSAISTLLSYCVLAFIASAAAVRYDSLFRYPSWKENLAFAGVSLSLLFFSQLALSGAGLLSRVLLACATGIAALIIARTRLIAEV